ncbi:MAG: large repetitive protein, partial [Miltoncostaeaceae bacterium]|nr:large repetitive protein [Miltoncostaeaceae bacterium]
MPRRLAALVVAGGRSQRGWRAGPVILALLAVVALALMAAATDRAASAAPNPLTVVPVADGFVQSDKPTATAGTQSVLRIDGSPVWRAYLRFNPQQLSGKVTKALLRLRANSALKAGYTVSAVSDVTWLETTLNFNNAPAYSAPVGSSGPVSSGAWNQVDVTSLVKGNGPVGFALATTNATALSLASRESGANAPQLVITTQADTTPPAAPGRLGASAAGEHRIDLSWSAPADPDVAGYRVYRDGSATVLASPTATAYADTGLAAGSPHSYVVVAVDAGGNASPASAPASATTADLPPAAPTGLAASAVGQDRIDLSWSAPGDTDVVGYRVYRDGSATALASPTATAYADTGLTSASAHTYVVVAVDAAGNASPASAPASASTADLPPAAPGGLVASAAG